MTRNGAAAPVTATTLVASADVLSLYEELKAMETVPVVPAPRSELLRAERGRAELHAKWTAGESIARMDEIADQPWGIRELPLLAPNNTLLRFGQVLTWARRNNLPIAW